MDREYVKGQRLYVETNDSNLEGLFYCMDHDVMTLTDVILHPSGEKIGFTRLNKNEVIYGKLICQHIDVWNSWFSFGSYAEDSETFTVYSKTLLIRSAWDQEIRLWIIHFFNVTSSTELMLCCKLWFFLLK